MTNIHAQKEICQWTGGLIESAPLTIGYPPAKVEKKSCECDGEEYCIYEVEWKKKINLLNRIRTLIYHRRDVLKLQAQALEESLEKLLERYEKLLESEKKHRTLVETIKDVVYTVDLQGRFTYVSPNIEKMTGYKSRALIGEHFFEILSPGYRNIIKNTFTENVKNRKTATLEVKIITRHGQEIPMELNTTMLYGAHGEPIGRIGVGRDVTWRYAEEEKRKEMEVKALTQDKLASLGEIATGVAHEINQPLSFIKIIFQSALKDIENNELKFEELTEDFQDSLHQIDKITNIISHLRTFGRSDVTLFGPVNLSEVIRDTLILMKERVRLRNITMNIDVSESFPMLRGNHIKLEQVFLNLIQNSMDAMAEQGSGKIILKARTDNDHALISFSDTGYGVSDELLEKIFEPFFTTKEVNKGTGIGLSIVYGIIKEHKGEITCGSKKGEGTTFKIRLPIYKEQSRCSSVEALNT